VNDDTSAAPSAATGQVPGPNGAFASRRPRAPVSMVVLATLAVGYTLWLAQAMVLPVLLALFLSLVGSPVLRVLGKLHLPRALGALILLLGGLAGGAALVSQLWEPASSWFHDAPRELRQLAPKLRALTKPMQDANRAAENFARAASGQDGPPLKMVSAEPADPYRALTTAPRAAASVLAVVLLTYFFMVFGANLQRGVLGLLPDYQQKRFTVDLLKSMEQAMSRYVLTISLINAVVGMVFAGALYLVGLPPADALLWGTAAALLNFAPFVGPLVGMMLMLVVGLVSFDTLWQSLLPSGIYLGLHLVEGQIVTPIVLGRQMHLSPLVLVLALMLFGLLWGITGLLLAVPLMVCAKLVLQRMQGLEGWARLLE